VVCITFGFVHIKKSLCFRITKPSRRVKALLLFCVRWQCAPYIGKDQLDLVLSLCVELLVNLGWKIIHSGSFSARLQPRHRLTESELEDLSERGVERGSI